MALGVAAVLCASLSVQARPAPMQDPAAAAAPQAPDQLLFKNDVAFIWNIIKAPKAAEWEAGWAEIKAKLIASEKPELKQQGESIKILKIDTPPAVPPAPPADSVTYIFYLDPPSKTQSYDPTKIIYYSGAWGADTPENRPGKDAMYAKIKDAYMQLNPIPLVKIGG